MEKEKYIKAGKICSEVKKWIIETKLVQKGKPLIEIAEAIEDKIFELGGEPAFPVNLSINEIAAHYTPSHDDESLAQGLIKVDFGVHIEGFAADNAISFDLENSEENKNLIESAKKSLQKAIEEIKKNKSKTTTKQIGEAIQKSIESENFLPIINLSGHSIEEYDLHAGLTIPNISISESSSTELGKGIFAIEPFVTTSTASGKVNDGKPSGIYQFTERKPVRSPSSREILNYIEETHGTLPFCSRWLIKEFGTRTILALRDLENTGSLHQFSQLVEASKNKVAQVEHSILIDKDEVIVLTE